MSINLLPEELRRPEPKPPAAKPTIQFTNPSRTDFREQRPEVVVRPAVPAEPWYRRLFGRRAAHGHVATPTPVPAPRPQPQPVGNFPAERPVGAAVPPQQSSQPAPSPHWWQRSPAVNHSTPPGGRTVGEHHRTPPNAIGQPSLHQPTNGGTTPPNGRWIFICELTRFSITLNLGFENPPSACTSAMPVSSQLVSIDNIFIKLSIEVEPRYFTIF